MLCILQDPILCRVNGPPRIFSLFPCHFVRRTVKQAENLSPARSLNHPMPDEPLQNERIHHDHQHHLYRILPPPGIDPGPVMAPHAGRGAGPRTGGSHRAESAATCRRPHCAGLLYHRRHHPGFGLPSLETEPRRGVGCRNRLAPPTKYSPLHRRPWRRPPSNSPRVSDGDERSPGFRAGLFPASGPPPPRISGLLRGRR